MPNANGERPRAPRPRELTIYGVLLAAGIILTAVGEGAVRVAGHVLIEFGVLVIALVLWRAVRLPLGRQMSAERRWPDESTIGRWRRERREVADQPAGREQQPAELGRRSFSGLWVIGAAVPVLTIVLTILNTGGAFYTAPKPKRESIHIVKLDSNFDTSLTTLPYLVSTRATVFAYAASAVTAATVKHGGWFTCTITKPVTDQIPRAAKCVRRPLAG